MNLEHLVQENIGLTIVIALLFFPFCRYVAGPGILMAVDLLGDYLTQAVVSRIGWRLFGGDWRKDEAASIDDMAKKHKETLKRLAQIEIDLYSKWSSGGPKKPSLMERVAALEKTVETDKPQEEARAAE